MQSMMPRASPDQAWSDRLDGWMEWNNGTLERWNAGTLERWNYLRTYRSSDVGHFYLTMTGAQMRWRKPPLTPCAVIVSD